MDREITNNTLFNEIIRIDFYKIKDIDSMAQKIQELLTPEKYNFKTVDIRNVNINIEDPETLFTQELIKSNINTTKNYEYISQDENHKFVINEYFVIFEKNNFLTYSKIEKYLENLKKIIDTIVCTEKELKITRVGIRKMNQLFVGSISSIKKYFNISIPKEDYEILDEYSITQKNVDNVKYSSNIVLNLKKGKGTIEKKQIQMYRFVWDIDCYVRKVETDMVIKEVNNLNNHLFEKYANIITENLYKILQNNNLDYKSLQVQDDIYGGINKNG